VYHTKKHLQEQATPKDNVMQVRINLSTQVRFQENL